MSRKELLIDDSLDEEMNQQQVDSGPTPRSLLRGLTSKASSMAGSLSKGVLVAQQWTKEKLGTAKTSSELDAELTQNIAVIQEISNQAKAIEKALSHTIQAEHAALLQHEQLAQLISKAALVHEATQSLPSSTINQTPTINESDQSAESEATQTPASQPSLTTNDIYSSMKGLFTADAVAKARDLPLNLNQFQPYIRRLLAVRMQVCDEKSVFLNHLQSLITATVKPALSAVQQLEIDRLHNDACQSKVNQMTSVNYTFNTPTDETEFINSLKNARDKADTAHTKLERSKVMVTEHAAHLTERFHSTIERGINQYMIVELEHWMQSLQLLSKMKKGDNIAVKQDSISPLLKPIALPVSPALKSTPPQPSVLIDQATATASVDRPQIDDDEVKSSPADADAPPDL